MHRFFIPWFFLLLSCSFSRAEPSYRLNHQYFKAQNVAAQQAIEIHYFFSFQCAGCGRLYPILEPYFHENINVPIFYHPLASNQAGAQLIKAYEVLKQHEQGQQYIRALYQAPATTRLSDKDVINIFKKEKHLNFEIWWEEIDEKPIQKKMGQDLKYAKNFHLRALPMVYITGPQGAFYMHPSPDLPLDKIPGCIEAVISLQQEINRPNPK